ncbi:MAG TPA: ABC transporter ATP-binding protein [Thermaerobacter sp.]
MVEVEELTKRYGAHKAVERVSFRVERGTTLALWGHNGAGKSTIIACLLGLLQFEGTIRIDGLDVRRRGREARRRLGFVPQQVGFPPAPVRELVAFHTGLRGLRPAAASPWLQRLGLEQVLHLPVHALSGGMRQRLALALALAGDPPLLVLDEPTANLDVASRGLVVDLLQELRRGGRTIVLASHRRSEVLALADRVVVLDAGRVVAEGPPRRVQLWLGEDWGNGTGGWGERDAGGCRAGCAAKGGHAR